MKKSTVLNNKDEGRKQGACSHVLTFEPRAEHTLFKCVKCGHSEAVRYFD